jgi:hypothetical protein
VTLRTKRSFLQEDVWASACEGWRAEPKKPFTGPTVDPDGFVLAWVNLRNVSDPDMDERRPACDNEQK